MRRIIATSLILSVTAGVACACGGGRAASDAGARGATSTTTGPTATVGSGSPVAPGSKVSFATQALGEAINLHRSDVPAMRQVLPAGENRAFAPAQRRECGRAPSLFEEPGGFHSPTFTQGGGSQTEAVRSAVRLAPSATAAANQLAAKASASFLACFERYLRGVARHVSATPAAVSVSALPFPLPGVSGSHGFRISRRPSHPVGEQAPTYTDVFEFASGRVAVALTAIRAPQPFPAATERRLLSLLLGRAKANET